MITNKIAFTEASDARAWYVLDKPESLQSPALLLSSEGIRTNLRKAIELAGGADRLRPHVKTHKMRALTELCIHEGVDKFKCATLKEAYMLAESGAKDVLLAYPLSGPRAEALRRLQSDFPSVHFCGLVDSDAGVKHLANVFMGSNLAVYLDVNVGMNRTGVIPSDAEKVVASISEHPELTLVGLHAYDGHIHDSDQIIRCSQANTVYNLAEALRQEMAEKIGSPLSLVIGGSPTFVFHAQRAGADVEVSPGTFMFWDAGYRQHYPELPFEIAAVLLTRVVSVIDEQNLCLDLGHKSVASENPLPRVEFPTHPGAVPFSHSEEHLVVQLHDALRHQPGDIWYAIPMHICPTVNLYDEVLIIKDNEVVGTWPVTARGH